LQYKLRRVDAASRRGRVGQAERRDCRPILIGRLQCWVLCLVTLVLWGCFELPAEPPKLGQHEYSHALNTGPCPLGERSGPGGVSNDERTEHGIKYTVRTPANYNPGIFHPLLMVYAPAGSSRFRSERLTDLTFEATSSTPNGISHKSGVTSTTRKAFPTRGISSQYSVTGSN